MKNSVDMIKLVVCVLFLFCVPARAYEITATWQLYDTTSNSVIRTLTDGQRIDLHDLANRNSLAIIANFTYKGSGSDLHGHTAWIDWTLIHSERSNQHTRRTDQEEASGGWWPVCGETDGEIKRCSDLSTVGTFTIDAGAWFSDERTTGLLGSDSIMIRIVDNKPTIKPPAKPRPGRPSGPTCHGDPDACKAVIANKPWWDALKRLCTSFPGADLAIGNGAILRCPE